MATIDDVPTEYSHIKSVTDERKRPGPGLHALSHDGDLVLIDDPRDVPGFPDNTVIVDRARFDRLLSLADAAQGLWAANGNAIDTFWDTLARLQPGDCDPLP